MPHFTHTHTYRHDSQADPSKAKALQRALRPALDMWRQLEQQPAAGLQQQQQRRRRQWGGLGLGWAVLTWDAAVPGMRLPPEPWSGLLERAIQALGSEDEDGGGGQEEASVCLCAALGTVAVAASSALQQPQSQQQQPQRRWADGLGQAAAAAVLALLQQQQQQPGPASPSSPDRVAVRLAALPALAAFTTAGATAAAEGRLQGVLADCWALYHHQQEQQQQEQEQVPPALVARAAAAAILQRDPALGKDTSRLGQLLRALAADFDRASQQHGKGTTGQHAAAGAAAAAAAMLLLAGHDVLALPPMEVHIRHEEQPRHPTGAAAMEVVTVDDEDDDAGGGGGGGQVSVVMALDGRRAVLLPTTSTGAGGSEALLLLPADGRVSVGDVLAAAWQQQDALRVGVVRGVEPQQQQQQRQQQQDGGGVLRVEVAFGEEAE